MSVSEVGSFKISRRNTFTKDFYPSRLDSYNIIINEFFTLDWNECRSYPSRKGARFPYLGMTHFYLNFNKSKILIGHHNGRKGFISETQSKLWNIPKRYLNDNEIATIKSIIRNSCLLHNNGGVRSVKKSLLGVWDYINSLDI